MHFSLNLRPATDDRKSEMTGTYLAPCQHFGKRWCPQALQPPLQGHRILEFRVKCFLLRKRREWIKGQHGWSPAFSQSPPQHPFQILCQLETWRLSWSHGHEAKQVEFQTLRTLSEDAIFMALPWHPGEPSPVLHFSFCEYANIVFQSFPAWMSSCTLNPPGQGLKSESLQPGASVGLEAQERQQLPGRQRSSILSVMGWKAHRMGSSLGAVPTVA